MLNFNLKFIFVGACVCPARVSDLDLKVFFFPIGAIYAYEVLFVGKRPRSLYSKMSRWQVTPKHAYTRDSTKSERADFAVIQT